FQDSVIDRAHNRVLIGELDLCHAVDLVDAFQSGLLCPGTDGHRLAASCDTAPLAGHDFYEIIMNFPSLHLVQHFLRRVQAVDNSDLQFSAVQSNRRFLDAVHAADTREADSFQIFGPVAVHQTAQHSLCHTACNTEDR